MSVFGVLSHLATRKGGLMEEHVWWCAKWRQGFTTEDFDFKEQTAKCKKYHGPECGPALVTRSLARHESGIQERIFGDSEGGT